MPDVTIIGAGPAGSAAALLLARRGWAVTLVEQARFPRDKVCGECLSHLGGEVLGRLGLTGALRERGAVELREAALRPPKRRPVSVRLPRPMTGISRRALDQLLLDAAREAGARVCQPARCEFAASRGDRAGAPLTLRVRDLVSNATEEWRPSHVILGDGKAALGGAPPRATGDFGIKAHYEAVNGPRDAIELFGCGGGVYGGLAPVEGGRWNASFSVPATALRAPRGDVDAVFAAAVATNDVLRERVASARRVGPWLASPLPRFAVRGAWPAGVIPVGNAAAALEPIGGEGMGLALRSAELAAEALDAGAGRWTGDDVERLRRQYRDLWRVRRVSCRMAALALSSRAWWCVGSILLALYPDAPSEMMGWMGKG